MNIDIENYRIIKKKILHFEKNSFNLIKGNNGVGKTSVFKALEYLLFGINKPDNKKCSIKFNYNDYNFEKSYKNKYIINAYLESYIKNVFINKNIFSFCYFLTENSKHILTMSSKDRYIILTNLIKDTHLIYENENKINKTLIDLSKNQINISNKININKTKDKLYNENLIKFSQLVKDDNIFVDDDLFETLKNKYMHIDNKLTSVLKINYKQLNDISKKLMFYKKELKDKLDIYNKNKSISNNYNSYNILLNYIYNLTGNLTIYPNHMYNVKKYLQKNINICSSCNQTINTNCQICGDCNQIIKIYNKPDYKLLLNKLEIINDDYYIDFDFLTKQNIYDYKITEYKNYTDFYNNFKNQYFNTSITYKDVSELYTKFNYYKKLYEDNNNNYKIYNDILKHMPENGNMDEYILYLHNIKPQILNIRTNLKDTKSNLNLIKNEYKSLKNNYDNITFDIKMLNILLNILKESFNMKIKHDLNIITNYTNYYLQLFNFNHFSVNLKIDDKKIKYFIKKQFEDNIININKVSDLSGGEQNIIKLCVFLAFSDLLNNDFIILDEALSNVYIKNHEQILYTLKVNVKKTVIIISHRDIDFIFDKKNIFNF